MKFPAIIVNFKAYESALGKSALKLAKIHQDVAKERGITLAIAPSTLDVSLLMREVSIPVFMQHVDPVDFGSKTGSVPPAAAIALGAAGTLLNHAERRLSSEVLRETIGLCRQVGLFTVVCAENLDKIKEIVPYRPDAIAYEPPELIGGNVSVSTAQPDIISEAVSLAGDLPLLVGAGVKTREDVHVARRLGAQGVLLASGVVLSSEPEKVLYNLAMGL